MKNVSNLNVGDIISVYYMSEHHNAKLVRKDKLNNYDTCPSVGTAILESTQNEIDLCWNPMIESFIGSDRKLPHVTTKRAAELYYGKLEMVAYAQLREWPEIQGIKSALWALARIMGKTRIEMELEISRQIPIKY